MHLVFFDEKLCSGAAETLRASDFKIVTQSLSWVTVDLHTRYLSISPQFNNDELRLLIRYKRTNGYVPESEAERVQLSALIARDNAYNESKREAEKVDLEFLLRLPGIISLEVHTVPTIC
jgi:hypothetical protein